MSATQQQHQNGQRPSRSDRVRDGLSFILAWGIIGWQMLGVPPEQVNEAFLILAAGILGVPYGAEAVTRIRGGSTTPPEPSSPSSPSPSSPA